MFTAALLFSSVALACTWDSDTSRDEATLNPERFDILIGQFAHHGVPYYRQRIERFSDKNHLTRDEKNDLAVAHMRVGRFNESEDLLIEILDEYPDYYPAISNRGVLAKKSGDFETAIEFIEKALAINPEGHMGIGDWYLKMLRWRQSVENGTIPRGYFIPLWSNSDLDRDVYLNRLFDLIRNDQSFSDGYLMAGKLLEEDGEHYLAYIAYSRARLLDHPKTALIERKIEALEDLRDMRYSRSQQAFRFRETNVVEFLNAAKEWRDLYAQEEMSLSAKGIEPSFIAMKRHSLVHLKKYFPAELRFKPGT
jgi:tetratricopeptide (TPR) repeat protein